MLLLLFLLECLEGVVLWIKGNWLFFVGLLNLELFIVVVCIKYDNVVSICGGLVFVVILVDILR